MEFIGKIPFCTDGTIVPVSAAKIKKLNIFKQINNIKNKLLS